MSDLPLFCSQTLIDSKLGTNIADPRQDPTLAKEQAKAKADAAIGRSDIADPREDPQLAKEQAKNKASAAASKAKDKIPEKHKQRARDETQRAKDFFNEEFPKERKDQFVWRMKKVCKSELESCRILIAMNRSSSNASLTLPIKRLFLGCSPPSRHTSTRPKVSEELKARLQRVSLPMIQSYNRLGPS